MIDRIQRQRTAGWKQPPNTLYVGRPGQFGNPFSIYRLPGYRRPWHISIQSEHATPEALAIRTSYPLHIANKANARLATMLMFREWIALPAQRELRQALISRVSQQGIEHLSCWCPVGEPCHADMWCEIVNKELEG